MNQLGVQQMWDMKTPNRSGHVPNLKNLMLQIAVILCVQDPILMLQKWWLSAGKIRCWTVQQTSFLIIVKHFEHELVDWPIN